MKRYNDGFLMSWVVLVTILYTLHLLLLYLLFIIFIVFVVMFVMFILFNSHKNLINSHQNPMGVLPKYYKKRVSKFRQFRIRF